MSLINRSIPNLIGGVSQQPEILRLDNQATEQLNGISNVVEGLKKRPPCTAIAKLSSSNITNAFIHTINRDVNERYVVVITNGAITVHTISGVSKTIVSTTNALSYLGSSNPRQDFKCLTVNDYTYIVNKTKTVAMASTTSAAKVEQAIYTVTTGVGNSTTAIPYSITIDGTTSTFNSSDNNSKTIRDGVKSAIGTVSGLTIANVGDSSFSIIKASGTLVVSASDGYGDQASQVIKDEVQNFADLPAEAINNMIVEVKGNPANNFYSYFVKFKSSTKIWEETVKPGIKTTLNDETMPLLLIRTADGNFRLTQADGSSYTISGTSYDVPAWGVRDVGDEDTSPQPSFVGTKIRDMFFHRNRLGFLADENVIMTRNGKFFEWFNETVTDSLDTDIIDINVSHTKVSILTHAVAFDEQLLLFSDQTQFILAGGASLTPNNVNVTVTTEYENSNSVKPVGSGSNVFFAFDKGKFSGLREMYVEDDGETNKGEDITANVPKYIPSELFKFATASNENILVCLSSKTGHVNELYVYQWFIADGRRLQSAWHKWTIGSIPLGDTGTRILNIDFIGTDLYIITNRSSDGVFLEKMDCSPAAVDEGATYLTYLDRKLTQAQVTRLIYNSVTKRTTITLPYGIQAGDFFYSMKVVGAPGGSNPPGVIFEIITITNTTIVVKGNLTGLKFFVGVDYGFVYEFSQQYLAIGQAASGTGNRTRIREGRLQIRNWTVSYDDTAHFTVEVTPLARNTSTYTFTAVTVGSSSAGAVNLEDGFYNFAIQSRNEDLVVKLKNDSHLPSNFVNAEWEGYYVSQSRSN